MKKSLYMLICGAMSLVLMGCAHPKNSSGENQLDVVHFAHDSAKISESDVQKLKSFISEHKEAECPKYVVFVDGHANSIGTPKYNQKLSQKRANAVRDTLVVAGIPKNKIRTKGYGSKIPVADNKTTKGLEANRRAEIGFMPIIVAKDAAQKCGCAKGKKCDCGKACGCKAKKADCGCKAKKADCGCKMGKSSCGCMQKKG